MVQPQIQRRVLPKVATQDSAVTSAGQGIFELLSAAPDTPVQSGGRTVPAAEAQRALLAPVIEGAGRAQPQRLAIRTTQADTVMRGNQALRAQYLKLTPDNIDSIGSSADGNARDQTVRGNAQLQSRRSFAGVAPIAVQRNGGDSIRRVSPGAGATAAIRYRDDPAAWCKAFGDTPRISRLLADGDRLTPDGEFILRGSCFGRARGSVQITLPAPVGTLTLTPLEWQDDKLLAKLPADISGLAIGEARVTVLRNDQVLSQIRPARFEPSWVEQDIPSRMIALRDCAAPGLCSAFDGGASAVPPPTLAMLLLPWTTQPVLLGAAAIHLSDQLVAGRDVFQVQLPEWARVSGSAEWIERQHTGLSSISVNVGGDLHDLTRAPGERPAATVTVDWRMNQPVTTVRREIGFHLLTGPYAQVEISQYGYCNYSLNLKALVPRGMSL